MSPGAKLVYAAVFASEYRQVVKSPPARIVMAPRTDWEEWELDQATRALEDWATGHGKGVEVSLAKEAYEALFLEELQAAP